MCGAPTKSNASLSAEVLSRARPCLRSCCSSGASPPPDLLVASCAMAPRVLSGAATSRPLPPRSCRERGVVRAVGRSDRGVSSQRCERAIRRRLIRPRGVRSSETSAGRRAPRCGRCVPHERVAERGLDGRRARTRSSPASACGAVARGSSGPAWRALWARFVEPRRAPTWRQKLHMD
jgi:hypothetical protein